MKARTARVASASLDRRDLFRRYTPFRGYWSGSARSPTQPNWHRATPWGYILVLTWPALELMLASGDLARYSAVRITSRVRSTFLLQFLQFCLNIFTIRPTATKDPSSAPSRAVRRTTIIAAPCRTRTSIRAPSAAAEDAGNRAPSVGRPTARSSSPRIRPVASPMPRLGDGSSISMDPSVLIAVSASPQQR